MTSNFRAPEPFLDSLSGIRARRLLPLFFAALIGPSFFLELLWLNGIRWSGFYWTIENAASLTGYMAIGCYMVWCGAQSGLLNACIAQGKSGSLALKGLVVLAIPLLLSSYAFLFLTYVPISIVFPEFIAEVLSRSEPPILWQTDADAILGNAISVLLLVIVGPVVEEVFFRGFLLARWRKKFGATMAIVFTSLLFAVFHLDPIGAFFFGVILALVTLRTESLLGPIVIHVTYNLLVVCLVFGETAYFGDTVAYTIEDLRAEWWIAGICGAISFPWLIIYGRRLIAEQQSVEASRTFPD